MQKEGLSENQVIDLQKKHGKNILPKKEKISAILIFFSQFRSPLIYILLFAALVSLATGEYFDVYLISAVILIDVIMGFYQEYKAQKTLFALRNILREKAFVIRGGQKLQVDISELVPGDIVILGSGDKIPADGKLIEGINFLVDEAILTGESEALEKDVSKDNLIYTGTTVLSGSSVMLVEKIGVNTEIGKIGKSLGEIEEESTPLQEKLNAFSKKLIYIIIGICLIIFTVGVFFQDRNLLEMFRISIVLAVASVPAGLPIAVTVIMALGMHQILKKKGLVKKLISIETLGSTMVICTDKTGTLTEGIMRVVKTKFSDKKIAILAMALNNDERTNLEISLINYLKSQKLNPKTIQEENPRIYQEAFSSETMQSISINKVGRENYSYLMGAPDIIIDKCDLSLAKKKEILANVELWAEEGLRILGLSYKKGSDIKKLKQKKNFHWLGLIGIRDPLRREVREVINKAKNANISTKIVTGDYLTTAIKVGEEIGLRTGKENIIEGADLEKLTDDQLKEKIFNIDIFARISPHQKLKIIKALQELNQVVAMTGDGVNDAPALRKADIGVAVGEGASDVAKEASDLILLDGNFKTIVAAIEEGRLVFSNIKKVIACMLSNSFAEIVLIFAAMLLALPAPLSVVQILWLYLICDGPPDMMLSFEPKEKHLMQENPRNLTNKDFFDNFIKFIVIVVSAANGMFALLFFWYYEKLTGNLALAQTIAFASLGIVSLIYIFSFKSFKNSLFKTENFFGNKYLIWGVIYGLVLLFAAIYLPIFNKLLGTVPLSVLQWLPILVVGILLVVIIELAKLYYYHRNAR